MKIIPLKGVSNYDVVEVTWSKKSEGVSYDFSQSSKNRRLNSLNVRNKSNQVTAQLPTYEHWDEKWGAVMRVQAISYNAGDVNLRDLDGNARTVFLYPDNRVSRGSSSKVIEMETYDLHTPHPFTDDASRLDVAVNKPATSVNGSSCDNRVANGEYMCKALLKLPSGKDTSYLTLAGIYARGKSVDVRVRLLKNDGSVVKFNNVQPKIDSTGRANNEFRRVEARVEATPSEDAVPVPRAAIASDGDLCKNYMITDNASDFSANGCSQSIIKPETQP